MQSLSLFYCNVYFGSIVGEDQHVEQAAVKVSSTVSSSYDYVIGNDYAQYEERPSHLQSSTCK